MQLFVYKLRLTPSYHDYSAWTDGVQATLKAHGAYLHSAVERGTVVIVGRTDTELKDNFGITVFKAEDLAAAQAFMAEDPVVKAGIMSAEVFPFKLLMVTEDAKKWNVW